jgi:predicted NUDIX family NTP pyrophosphohydrolase
MFKPHMCCADFDVESLRSNSFELEYPVDSGVFNRYPEIDEAKWTALDNAKDTIHKGQAAVVRAMVKLLERRGQDKSKENEKEKEVMTEGKRVEF